MIYSKVLISVKKLFMSMVAILLPLSFLFVSIRQIIVSSRIFLVKDTTLPPISRLEQFPYLWIENNLGHMGMQTFVDVPFILGYQSFGWLGLLFINHFAWIFQLIFPFILFQIYGKKILPTIRKTSLTIGAFFFVMNPIYMDVLWGGNGGIYTSIIYSMIPLLTYCFSKLSDSSFKGIFFLSLIICLICHNFWISSVIIFFIALYLFLLNNLDFRKLIAIPLGFVFGFLNMPFLFSRIHASAESFDYNMIKADFAWCYQKVNPWENLMLSDNMGNLFVFRNINHLQLWGALYLILFIIPFFIFLIFKKDNKFKRIYTCTLIMVVLLQCILMTFKLLVLVDTTNIILPLAVFRNPFKIEIIEVFFTTLIIIMLFDVIFSKLSTFLKTNKHFLIIKACAVISIYILLTIPLITIYDGYCGLSSITISRNQSENLRLVQFDASWHHLVNQLPKDSDVVILPFSFCVPEQMPLNPHVASFFFPNLKQPKWGGIIDGYSCEVINTYNNVMKLFINGGVNGSNDDVLEGFLRQLGVDYIILDANTPRSESVFANGLWFPYLCPQKLKEYSILKIEDGFTIYARKNDSQDLNDVYLLSRTPLNLTEKHKFLNMSAMNIPVNTRDFEINFYFKLIEQYDNISWHSFSIYLKENNLNFVRITFHKNEYLEIGKMINGIWTPCKFLKSEFVNPTELNDLVIQKIRKCLTIKSDNQTAEYFDVDLDSYQEVVFLFENSAGAINISSLYRIETNEINFLKNSPTSYSLEVFIHQPSILVLAEAYDNGWVCYVNGKRVYSFPLYGVFNGFWINQTGLLEITIEYEPQKWFYIGCAVSLTTFFACTAYLAYSYIKPNHILQKLKRKTKTKEIISNDKNLDKTSLKRKFDQK